MVGWHHRLNGHDFEQTPGVGDGQGSLVCSSPWGHKESDMTEQLNRTEFFCRDGSTCPGFCFKNLQLSKHSAQPSLALHTDCGWTSEAQASCFHLPIGRAPCFQH